MPLQRVVLVTADLMFGSKVEGMIREAGFDPVVVMKVPEVTGDELIWIADLAQGDFAPEQFAEVDKPVLAYFSHVETGVKQRALAAGIGQIVPRSRMAREGADLIRAAAAAAQQ